MKLTKHIKPIVVFGIAVIMLCINNIQSQAQENLYNNEGQRTGYWEIKPEGGDYIEEKGKYIDGEKDGVWKSYYSDGTLKHKITFEMGIAKGPAKLFYSNGGIREEGNWQEGFWVGEYRFYYPNGQIAYEWSYNQIGRREGEQVYFFPNGEKKYLGKWANGKVDGHVEVYDSTGMMVQVRNYDDGQFNNISQINQPSNNKQSQTMPFYGTGNHTIFRLNGEIYEKGYFVDGKLKDGEKFIYDDNDNLRQVRVYESGEIIRIKSGRELESLSNNSN